MVRPSRVELEKRPSQQEQHSSTLGACMGPRRTGETTVPKQATIAADALVFDLGNTLIADPRAAVIGRIAERSVRKLSRWKKGLHPGGFAQAWLAADGEVHGRFWSHFMQEEPVVQRALIKLGVARETRALLAPEILAAYRRALRDYLSHHYDTRPLRQALIRQRKAGKLLLVFSDDREIGTENMLRWAGLLDFFKPNFYCSEQLGMEKGIDDGLFNLLFDKLCALRPDLTPDRCVHIGDVQSKDIDPPKAAGWRAILHRPPSHADQSAMWRDYDEHPAHQPDAILTHWRELGELIQ